MTGRTVLVLGATGKTGRRVVARLRAAGEQVRAASRSADVRFDWAGRSTWPIALSGAAAVYLVVPEEVEPVAPFVEQAVEAGVERFVVLSGRGADTYGDSAFGRSMIAADFDSYVTAAAAAGAWD
ncbi:hypothetical protein LZ318_03110 [Saccharopolyspora indica]|uniref:SDR family oxidoreductase n=1 Tax=Saccharopolyspora indica TaxID=1229659 RepID=UPI0022EA15C6|nr:hypothetical protein [Saccharopolyspora indica]MDA3649466.1 hypothetical protein [Saccharopolyspora indica]